MSVPAGGSGERQVSRAAELRLRVVSALVLVALALATLVIGGWLFDLVWTILAIVVFREWIMVAGASLSVPRQIIAAVAIAGMALSLWFENGWLAAFLVAVAVIAQVLAGGSKADGLWCGVGLLYASILASAVILVRHDPAFGLAGIAWMFAVVWTTDVAAYFTGRRFGGPKLAPAISPGKTWSGSIGGLLAGTLAGWLVFAIAVEFGTELPIGTIGALALSAVASVLGQAGDLGESAFKRHFGVKDSGRIIPGHGGVLDRLDAFWAVCALALLLLALRPLV